VSPGAAGGRFASTRWTMVNAAGRESDPHAAAALEELCQSYWPPLYSYLRRRGHDAADAQDLTQGFFLRLIERGDIRTADPARGRFRAFLLTALKRYAINEHERATAARRGGPKARLTLDFDQAERTYALDMREQDTPDRVFDRKWAGIAIDRAIQRLRDECLNARDAAVTGRLLPYLTHAGDLPSYRDVGEDLDITEGAVKVAVHRLRQRFGAMLRLEIGETVLAADEIEDEMRELLRAVSS
jgi:RNA polymerase sigma factor (sigma-70 family)